MKTKSKFGGVSKMSGNNTNINAKSTRGSNFGDNKVTSTKTSMVSGVSRVSNTKSNKNTISSLKNDLRK